MSTAAPHNGHPSPLSLVNLATTEPAQSTLSSETEEDATSAYDLIQAIDQEQIQPGDLSARDRQRCVAYLLTEGFTATQIANVLRISDRTVRRDRNALRKDDALAPDLTLGDELLGELQSLTHTAIARLNRLANNDQTPPHVRLRACDAITRAQQRLIDTANRLQYLEPGKTRLKRLRDNDPNKPNPFEQVHRHMQQMREASAKAARGLL